jgi:hypothetical protein
MCISGPQPTPTQGWVGMAPWDSALASCANVHRGTPYFSATFAYESCSPGSCDSYSSIASSIDTIVVELSRVISWCTSCVMLGRGDSPTLMIYVCYTSQALTSVANQLEDLFSSQQTQPCQGLRAFVTQPATLQKHFPRISVSAPPSLPFYDVITSIPKDCHNG